MTETQQTQQAAPKVDMQTGGLVMAIVPQSFVEVQRIAWQVIAAGVAPASLVKFAKADDSEAEIAAIGRRNVAAVSTVILAGAELGLPPMVSLRAFTVINGKPALYADGNVAVVRKATTRDGARIADYLKTGYTEVRDFICPVCKATFADSEEASTHFILEHDEQFGKLTSAGLSITPRVFGRTAPTDKSFAWCEAKRADNGEVYRETFSIEDAKQAGLWEADKPFKRAKVWRNGSQGWFDDVPNDAPWFRYWKRMLGWRAIGYCLRWLFADVLGGMADEYEAREIDGMMQDVTPPRQPTPPRLSPETVLPDVPADQGELHNPDQPEGGGNEVAPHSGPSIEGGKRDTILSATSNEAPKEEVRDPEHPDDYNQDESPPVIYTPAGEITDEVQAGLDEIAAVLATKTTEGEIEEAFDSFEVQAEYSGNDLAIAEAFKRKTAALHALAHKERVALEDAGQIDIFGGALPDVPEAE